MAFGGTIRFSTILAGVSTGGRSVVQPAESPDGGLGSDAVLLDNSTYFSAVRTLQERDLDANGVFNLGCLLEALILGERVVLSPTVAWRPSSNDLLFTMGPLEQFDVEGWSPDALAALFDAAIAESLIDVSSVAVWLPLGCDREDVAPARRVLLSWRDTASTDPAGFLPQYSGAVYLTDLGSKKTVGHLRTSVSESSPSYGHLAQFLLRTNVAYELSAHVPYHPHSHRLAYVSRRMNRSRVGSKLLAEFLLRESEQAISDQLTDRQANSILAEFGAFRHQAHLPLILAAVLSQAAQPDEILPIALRIRDERYTRRYRQWVGRLAGAAQGGDYERQRHAEAELDEARRVLFAELSKLYGADRRTAKADTVVRATSTLAGSMNPRELLDASGVSLAAKGGRQALRSAVYINEVMRTRRRRRNIVLLLRLAATRRQVESIDGRLQRVFGVGLSSEEMFRLWALQAGRADNQ